MFSRNKNYRRDKEWEETYHTQIRDLLKKLTPYLVITEITNASDEDDRKRATDFEVKIKGGTIAVRIRRAKYAFRDLTLRAKRDTGTKTELAKIREGYATHYLYAWTDKQNQIVEWILVNLDEARKVGLFDEKRELIPNRDATGKPDGTYFIAISVGELKEAGCLITYELKEEPQPRPKTTRTIDIHASYTEGERRALRTKSYLPKVEEHTTSSQVFQLKLELNSRIETYSYLSSREDCEEDEPFQNEKQMAEAERILQLRDHLSLEEDF